MARTERNIVPSVSYTVTNWVESRTLDCNANDDLLTADVLGTLIKDLIDQGIIKGTVSA